MNSVRLNILPEELIRLIYQKLFDLCMQQLVTQYNRDWIDSPHSAYRCIDCCPGKVFYPKKAPMVCYDCGARMCWRHWKRSIQEYYDTNDIHKCDCCTWCRWKVINL